MRVAIYARYSSDNQRDASIEDQDRVCRDRAESEGWQLVDCYSDHAVSGASLLRPGIQMLLADAISGKFDIILAEALDRLSRDQEDIAGIFKRLSFAGVKIVTLSEGEINHLHIGLKGTMNALFLKDLADKTRRGLRGRVEAGKSGGGKCYGYDVVKRFDASGEPVRGDRIINQQEANIIARIFGDYSVGKSPKAIAARLNKDGIPGPSGKSWGQSTINGNRHRGTGINRTSGLNRAGKRTVGGIGDDKGLGTLAEQLQGRCPQPLVVRPAHTTSATISQAYVRKASADRRWKAPSRFFPASSRSRTTMAEPRMWPASRKVARIPGTGSKVLS